MVGNHVRHVAKRDGNPMREDREVAEKKADASKKAPKKKGAAKAKKLSASASETPRLKQRYTTEIVPALKEQLNIENVNDVPRFEKIVVNMGVGAATQDKKFLQSAVEDMRTITGQQPMITRAKKSIASFKVREGMEIGCKVTLRGDRMWEFYDRLVSTAIPRIRDFRGLSTKSFDGRGNYSFGVTEQLIFPEIEFDKIDHTRGMDITFVTTAKTDEDAKALMSAFGFPFKD